MSDNKCNSKSCRCRRGASIDGDLLGIRRIVVSSELIMGIRREVRRLGMSNAMVTDGSHIGNSSFDAVIKTASKKISENLIRRMRTGSLSKGISIERIADNMIGVRRK